MKLHYYLIAGALAFSACTSNTPITENGKDLQAQNGTENSVKTIKSQEVKALVEAEQDLLILDVRTPEEYASGHLQNALLLNKNDAAFEAKIGELDRNKTYMVYCAKGGRSADAARIMKELGFTKIYDATEGFESLKQAGISVE